MNDKTETDEERARRVQALQCQCCRLAWKTPAELKEHLTYQAKRITDQLAAMAARL